MAIIDPYANTPGIPAGGPTPVASPGRSTTIRRMSSLPTTGEQQDFRIDMEAIPPNVGKPHLGVATGSVTAAGVNFNINVYGHPGGSSEGGFLLTALTDMELAAVTTGTGQYGFSPEFPTGYPAYSFTVTDPQGFTAVDEFVFYIHFGDV